ncbi:nucleotidyltransferase family protein [Vibrio ziniensis]|uniref:NTP transferase domain-containing protein n=1 Tax=Vibrio ziniensis TaxID=2711221 RepID=A0A6G7CMD2_9VIBR|nr:nucleotidyltransferase family protein [Vibrio ziniensis]QIH43291.1 NTP transferase domain-containing protein [Vibrio ziniensis]
MDTLKRNISVESKDNITAIILCGGLGTRLRTITHDLLPKPMVEVASRPFLEYLLDYLISQGVKKAVLAVSYHKELILEHFGNQYRDLNIIYSVEEQPLGTGGAIKHAMQHYVDPSSELVLILNGDTFVEYDLDDMLNKIESMNNKLVMAVKSFPNTDRYGRVTVNEDAKITAFEEKKSGESGQINAGVYLLVTSFIDHFPQLTKFSFETDFLENRVDKNEIYASNVSGYFIDIGVPKDYHCAQIDFNNELVFKYEE